MGGFLGLKTPTGKRFMKGAAATGAGFASLTSGILSPITQLTSTAAGFIDSPFTYVFGGILAVVLLTTIVKGADTAQVAVQNPESLRVMAQAMR